MRAKDRVMGWAFMAAWALVAYLPIAIGALSSPMVHWLLEPQPGLEVALTTIYLALASLWAFGLMNLGIHLCTKKPELTRSEFERQLWKLK